MAVEVADPDRFCQTLVYQLLHGLPRLLNGGVARDDVLAVVGKAGGIALGGIDVFEGDGEMHDVEIEVVDAPVFELLFADGLDAVVVVEGIPELGDEEEVFAFDDAFFDGAGDTLAGFYLVAVICGELESM